MTASASTRRGRSLGCAVALLVIAMVPGAGVAHADDGARDLGPRRRAVRAKTLRQRGLEHYLHREYQLAADELMESYRLDKRDETLFGWAEAVRATGDCPLARRIYRRLLDRTSDLSLVRQAEFGLTACEPAGTVGSPPGTVAEPEPLADPASEADPVVEPDARSHADEPAKPPVVTVDHRTSYFLIGGGAAAAFAGLVAYTGAADGTGDPGASHAATTAARSSGDWQRLIGASVGVIGSGIAVFGVLRYRGDAARGEPAVALAPYVSTTGFGVAIRGRY